MTTNPFNPSAANPRYIAGRGAEKAALADMLDAGNQSPVAVIFGPRGNGKTALAHWLERAARANGVETRYRYARACGTMENSQGYPPFLQAWGANLWRQTEAGAPIEADAMERARPAVDYYRFSFYEHRKEELVPYASSALEVAYLFAETPVAHETAILNAIRRGLPARASTADLADAFRDFRDLGVFWREPGAVDFYRPAIPSLMTSIREGQEAAIRKA